MGDLLEIIMNVSRNDMMMSDSQTKTAKVFLAAYIFVHHTQDGMEICDILGVKPHKLDKWTRSPKWKTALELWQCSIPNFPQGAEYIKRSKRKHLVIHKPVLYAKQLGRCAGCLDQLGERHLTIDHVVPLCAGGSHRVNNLQLLCYSCNFLKGRETNEYLINLLISQGIRR